MAATGLDNLQNIGKQQQQQADQYKANMGANNQDQYNLVADQALQNLKNQKSGINTGFNQRGLMYSGLNAGAQMGAEAGAAGQLSTKRAGINQAAEENWQNMQNEAVNSNAAAYNADTSRQWLAYQTALAEAQAKQQQQQSIISGIGGLIGMGAKAAI